MEYVKTARNYYNVDENGKLDGVFVMYMMFDGINK